ncbi:hypothetical protein BC830DRAFT_839768 [Chytriomyces sp. MP71]|nr:hypothetical protein BC830DRAFT_839768 [Chytriomyces sp. MP71]
MLIRLLEIRWQGAILEKYNPEYEHKLWTYHGNRDLVATHYPWFLPTYDTFEDPILRAEASRLFYMHQYGGVCADLDFECLKPLSGPAFRCARQVMQFDKTKNTVEERTRPAMLYWCLKAFRRTTWSEQRPLYLAPDGMPETNTPVLGDMLYPFSWFETFSKEVQNASLAMRSQALNRRSVWTLWTQREKPTR